MSTDYHKDDLRMQRQYHREDCCDQHVRHIPAGLTCVDQPEVRMHKQGTRVLKRLPPARRDK